MNSLLVVIRSILQNMIDNIDAGNSNLTDEECLEVLEQLRHFSNTKEIFWYKEDIIDFKNNR